MRIKKGIPSTKCCTKCKQRRSLSEFYNDKTGKFGKHSTCKTCFIKRIKIQNKQNPIRYRTWQLKYSYGITWEDYQNILREQNGVCAICGQLETATRGKSKIALLSVDHNHITGKIRGLLCHRCNCALGYLNESSKLALNLIKYIKKYI